MLVKSQASLTHFIIFIFYIESWDVLYWVLGWKTEYYNTDLTLCKMAQPAEVGSVSWAMNVYVWLVLTLPHVAVSSPVLLKCDCKICPKILEK